MKFLTDCVLAVLLMFIGVCNSSLAADSIKFGYDPDSVPISSRIKSDRGDTPTGFCAELLKHLRTMNYTINDIPVNFENRLMRFENNGGLPNNDYGIECSSATITQERIKTLANKYNAKFSDPFYSSEFAFIIKNENIKYLVGDPKDATKKLTIDIISSNQESNAPTTKKILDYVYNSSTVYKIKSRESAYIDLMSGKVDAYVSDEVLLRDLLYYDRNRDGHVLASAGYVIHSDHYSIEPYGIVVYDKNTALVKDKLLEEVNSWIKSDAGRTAVREMIDEKILNDKKQYENTIEEKKPWHEKI